MNTQKTENVSFEELLDKNGYLVYTNVGVSMMPLLRQRKDIMEIRKKGSERCRKYDAVLFKRPDTEGRGKYVLHRILKVFPDGTYWIVGDNCVEGEIVREENVLGILTSVNRNGRKISVTDPGYKAYVYLWCAPYHLRFFVLKSRRRLRSAAGKLLRSLGLRK